MAKWHKDLQPEKLALFLQEENQENGMADMFIRGLDFSKAIVLFDGAIEFDANMPGEDRIEILNRMSCEVAKKIAITARDVISSCNKLEQAYLAKPKIDFRFLTGVSIHSTINFPIIKTNLAIFNFNQNESIAKKNRMKLHETPSSGPSSGESAMHLICRAHCCVMSELWTPRI